MKNQKDVQLALYSMLNYLSLHTKVRRLGYIKILLKQYFLRDFLPIASFNQYFEKFASQAEITKQLEYYAFYYTKDNHGIIEDLGTGASSQYYTKLAEDLSVIAKSNYSYILTKYSKVYKVIYERYETEREKFRFINEQKSIEPLSLFSRTEDTKNPFALNTLDKIFFIGQLIEKDFLHIKAILKIIDRNGSINSRGKIKYETLKTQLFEEITSQLKEIQSAIYINPKDRKKANELELKFSKKDLKIRSYESIVEPRINWLLDLDIIDGVKFQAESLKLTQAGKVLVEFVNNQFDTSKIIETELVNICCKMYDIKLRMERNPEKRILKYLDFAFENFKTLAPNRITASMAFSYISIMCLLRDGLRLEFDDIKRFIFSCEGNGFSIDWYPSENDGSIKKIKNGI